MLELERQLQEGAQQVFEALRSARRRIVFLESCTGGLLASTMASVPGVSEVFCGSAVTYRNETKSQWLDVSREFLADPHIGAVSAPVAEEMCRGGLAHTPEADLAASITGHLGPGAPAEQDGIVFIGLLSRQHDVLSVQRHLMTSKAPNGRALREQRRREAAVLVLQAILKELA